MKSITIYQTSVSQKYVMKIQDTVNTNLKDIVTIENNICKISYFKHRRSVNQPVHPTIESGYYLVMELMSGCTFKINLSEINPTVVIPSGTTTWSNTESGASAAIDTIMNYC